MKVSLKIFFLIILTLFTLVSCKNKSDAPASGSGKGGTTIATVNNVPVTDEDVKFEIGLLPEQLQQMATSGEGLATLLDDVLKKEMLYQEAKKLNIDKSEEFKHRLQDLERRLIVEMLLVQEIEKNTLVTDEEAKQFYEENKERFTSPVPGSKNKKEPVPFDEVKDLIKDRLMTQKQRRAFEDYIENLSKSYTVKLDEDAIAATFGISVGAETVPSEGISEENADQTPDKEESEKAVSEEKTPEESKK